MTKQKSDKIAITERALIQRINRKLKPKGQMFKRTRGMQAYLDVGNYWAHLIDQAISGDLPLVLGRPFTALHHLVYCAGKLGERFRAAGLVRLLRADIGGAVSYLTVQGYEALSQVAFFVSCALIIGGVQFGRFRSQDRSPISLDPVGVIGGWCFLCVHSAVLL